MDVYDVIFEGNNLNDIDPAFGIELYNHDFNALPTQIIKKFKLARADKSVITSAESGDKEIPVYFMICNGDRPNTEISMRYLKALLQIPNGALIVSQAGVEVRYTATLNEFNHRWEGAKAYIEVIFTTSNPIGSEVSQTDLVNTNITASNVSLPVTIGGSSEAFPAFYLYIVSVTGGTGQTLSVKNSRTGQGINITRNWANDDNIEIDGDPDKMQVIINGAYADFDGIFPKFDTGDQVIAYSDTFATRSVNFISKYYQKTT